MEIHEIIIAATRIAITTFLAIVMFLAFLRYSRTFFAREISEPATVVGLKIITFVKVSKYRGEYIVTKYIVKFDTGKKILDFYVSAFAYGGLSEGEYGILTYKGERYINFE